MEAKDVSRCDKIGRRRSDDGGSSRKTAKAWLVGLVDDAFAGSGGRY